MPENGEGSETRDRQHMKIDSGETIVEHPNGSGPVVAYADSFSIGEETVGVQVKASELRQAITTDLADSYDDVFLFSDGKRIIVTDHREPIEEADEPTIGDFTQRVARTDVIELTEDVVRTMVGRDFADEALEIFGDGVVTVYFEEDYPVVVYDGSKVVAVAPVGKPQDLPARRKGGSPA